MDQSEILIKLRKLHNLTQKEFSELIGIDRTQVVKYEKNKHKITLQMFLLWCKKLHINPKDVL